MELGGRGFLNDPPHGGHHEPGRNSLAKYYEYSTITRTVRRTSSMAPAARTAFTRSTSGRTELSVTAISVIPPTCLKPASSILASVGPDPPLYSDNARTLYNGVAGLR